MENRTVNFCDRIIEWLIYISIFWMPFFKAGLEIGISLMFLVWLIKRVALYLGPSKQLPGNRMVRIFLMFKPVRTPLNYPILFFISAAFISCLNSTNIAKSMGAFLFRLLEWVFVYWAVVETINTRQRLKNLCVAIVLSAVIVVADAGAQYISGVDLICGRKIIQGRITSCFGHFNTLAMYLGPVIIIIMGFIQGDKKTWRRIFIILLILSLILLLLFSGSRGGWVSFFLSILLCALLVDRKIFIVMALMVAIFAVTFATNKKFKDTNISTRILWLGDSGRSEIWKGCINMFKEKPVRGFGMNTFMDNYPRYMICSPRGDYKSDLPHNCYLLIAVEMGVFGLLAFLCMLGVMFKSIFTGLKKMPAAGLYYGILTGLFGALTCYLIHSFFDNNLQTMQTAFLFWFMAGMSMATIKIWQGKT